MTLVHITKRALAVVGGREVGTIPYSQTACSGRTRGRVVAVAEVLENAKAARKRVTCPACLVLLDAEFEREGGE